MFQLIGLLVLVCALLALVLLSVLAAGRASNRDDPNGAFAALAFGVAVLAISLCFSAQLCQDADRYFETDLPTRASKEK